MNQAVWTEISSICLFLTSICSDNLFFLTRPQMNVLVLESNGVVQLMASINQNSHHNFIIESCTQFNCIYASSNIILYNNYISHGNFMNEHFAFVHIKHVPLSFKWCIISNVLRDKIFIFHFQVSRSKVTLVNHLTLLNDVNWSWSF